MPDDATLLDRYVRQRDALAFEVLVWRHAAGVWAACRRVLRHQQDAEDAFQCVWVVLALKAGTIGNRRSLGPWLHRVAVRAALRARRQRSRLPEQAVVEPVVTPPDPCDLRDRLDAEVDQLPENHRRAFVLCQLQGLTLEQAGLVLGCPPATVGTWVARAKQRLRGRLPAPSLVVPAAAALPFASVAVAVQSALNAACGHALADVASPSVVFLVKGALNAMVIEKVRVLATVLMAGLLIVGSGYAVLAGGKPTPPPVHALADEKPAPKKEAEAGASPLLAKLNELEAAQYLEEYEELLKLVAEGRKELREARLGGMAEVIKHGEKVMKSIQEEMVEVKGKLLELERERMIRGGESAKEKAGTSVLERVLNRLDAIDKRLDALEKKK